MTGLAVVVVIAAFVLFVVLKTAVVVPQQHAYVVERLGRFNGVLEAGFHVLVPFLDVIRYRHTLKEQALDIPEQIYITKDNVQVAVDGILYLKVMDPERRVLRDLELQLRDHAARADHAAQRDRQDPGGGGRAYFGNRSWTWKRNCHSDAYRGLSTL